MTFAFNSDIDFGKKKKKKKKEEDFGNVLNADINIERLSLGFDKYRHLTLDPVCESPVCLTYNTSCGNDHNSEMSFYCKPPYLVGHGHNKHPFCHRSGQQHKTHC